MEFSSLGNALNRLRSHWYFILYSAIITASPRPMCDLVARLDRLTLAFLFLVLSLSAAFSLSGGHGYK